MCIKIFVKFTSYYVIPQYSSILFIWFTSSAYYVSLKCLDVKLEDLKLDRFI